MQKHVSLVIACLGAQAAGLSITTSTSLPHGAAPAVDPAFAGFCFEERSFYYFAGPGGKPNNFSRNLIQAVADKTNVKPIIRVGGTSLDMSRGYDPNQPTAIKIPDDQESAGVPRNMTWGPDYFKAFANLDARYIVDIPFAYQNQSNAVPFGAALLDAIQPADRYAVEVGNEPNLYIKQNRRPASWSAMDYAHEWGDWIDFLDEKLNTTGAPHWQAAGLSAEVTNRLLPNATPGGAWEIPVIFEEGGLREKASRIRSASMHYYQTKLNPESSLQVDLMNHTAIKIGSEYIKKTAEYLNNLDPPIPLALCEIGNSLGNSTRGTNMQAVLGSALWQVDFMLHSASIGVNKINYQSGIVFEFALWNVGFPSKNRTNSVLAAYYGHIFAAEFVGAHAGRVQISEFEVGGVDDPALMSAYGAYEDGKLARIAIDNLEYWDGKPDCQAAAAGRPARNIALDVGPEVKSAQVKRLTAPCGATAAADQNITWGGMRWTGANDGVGEQLTEVMETLEVSDKQMMVSAAASEAIMVYLHY